MITHMKKKHPEEAISDVSSLLKADKDEDVVITECHLCPKAFGGKAFSERHIKIKHSCLTMTQTQTRKGRPYLRKLI